MNALTIQNVVTYNTMVAFDNFDLKLFPGMTAYVSIPVAEAKNVVKIPNGALRFKPDLTDSERNALYAKYGIKDNARATAAGRVAAASGDSAAPAARRRADRAPMAKMGKAGQAAGVAHRALRARV
jgi:HlyD family secretion protein